MVRLRLPPRINAQEIESLYYLKRSAILIFVKWKTLILAIKQLNNIMSFSASPIAYCLNSMEAMTVDDVFIL
jgi:hypothetical protein